MTLVLDAATPNTNASSAGQHQEPRITGKATAEVPAM
jgi:hypothetical protein